MVAGKQLELDLKDKVRDVLLCRHRHQNEKRHRHDEKDGKIHLPIIRSLADIGKKYSAARGLNDNSQGNLIGSLILVNYQHNLVVLTFYLFNFWSCCLVIDFIYLFVPLFVCFFFEVPTLYSLLPLSMGVISLTLSVGVISLM